LKIVAELIQELLILNTATRNGLPDGLLAVSEEGQHQLMSGVHGLNWFPTGPEVLIRILKWMGFVEFRRVWWQNTDSQNQAKGLGRLKLLAARNKNFFDHYDVFKR
jgi:hypothetical protein